MKLDLGVKNRLQQAFRKKIKLLICNQFSIYAANEFKESLPLPNEKENNYLFSFLCAAHLHLLFFTVFYQRIF